MGEIIDGNKIAEKIKNEIKSEIESLKIKFNKTPTLAAIQVGSPPGSMVYLRSQKKICDEVGINHIVKQLNEDASEEEISRTIESINDDPNIDGIILQMPLPKHIDARKMQRLISPDKDAEGILPENLGKLFYGEFTIAPSTALAVIEILKSLGVALKGKEAVVVGHSEIVGKPILLYLLSSVLESATPTVCHIATRDLSFHTRRAEILIVAVGKAGLITGEMVREGAIVIDIGINRVPLLDKDGKQILDEKGKPKTKIVGDVVFDEVKEKASYITPVPGGVGPITTVMLMKNVLTLFRSHIG